MKVVVSVAMLVAMAAGNLRASSVDRCTFDFKEASRIHFEKDDPSAPNIIKSVLDFQRTRMYVWTPRQKADLPVADDKLDAMAVAEREGDYFSMRTPVTVKDVVGEGVEPSWLHNFAAQTIEFPDDKPGEWRLTMQYRAYHEIGTDYYSAYVVFVDAETRKELGRINLPDTGPDSDYWYRREYILRLKGGHSRKCEVQVRLDGAGYLKFTNMKLRPMRDSARSEVQVKCHTYGDLDERVAVEAGDVGTVTICWNRTKGADIDSRRDGMKLVLPRGFELVGANVKPTGRNPLRVDKRPDGTTEARLPMYGVIMPELSNRFHPYMGLSILVRANCTEGTEGEFTFQAVRGENEPVGECGKVTLFAIKPNRCRVPERYLTGAMMHYDIEVFRWGEKANEIYADYLYRHGVRWLIPTVPHMLENPQLIGIWRRAGFKYITPQWHNYISNGYLIGNEKSRPESDRYKPPAGEKDYNFPGSACPSATYERRAFFKTNVIVKIEKATKGSDGMWHNWELHPFRGGCFCDTCMNKIKKWRDTVPHFQSEEHGRLCEVLAEEYKRMYGKDAPGFMPAISWSDFCSHSIDVDFIPSKRPVDYFRYLDWIPAWGPYHGWAANGPYNAQRGKSVWFHLAMLDSKASLERLFQGRKKMPKLMAQPAGPNWLIQPEWLEIQMNAALFCGWQACVPWIFPYGCDARHWAAFCRATDFAAKYENVVFDGVRNDAAVTVKPKEGFAQVCHKPDTTFLPKAVDVPLLQQVTYDYKGVRYVCVFNYDDESHCEFTLTTEGRDHDLSLPASACRVFEFPLGQADKDFWFVVNEDNDHFFKCDSSLMNEKGLVDYIDYVAQGKVTHFFMCVNGQRTSYDSKTWEPIWLGMDEPARKDTATAPDGTRDRWCVNAKKLFDAGIDPYAVWIRRCREKSVSPWVSMRMNDVHFCTISNYFRNATLPRTRRDLWLNPETDFSEWVECSLDYAKKEVRDYVFAQAEEMAERWDSDGLELDWMRFGYALKPSRAREDAHFLDEFVRDVRRMLDRVGEKRSRRMGLAVRVPRDPEIALELGYDVVKWAKEGWVDVVVAHSFLTVDTGIAVKKWLSALKGTKARLVPGIDCAAPAAFGMPSHPTQVPEYRGTAEIFQKQGATGVYVFNLPYNSKSEYRSDGTNDFNRDRDIAGTLYREGLSPSDIAGKQKAYLPVYHDFPFASMEPRSKDWRILAADHGRRRIFVMDAAPGAGNKVLKSFEPLADKRVDPAHHRTFNSIDEAKIVDGGRMVIGCSSSDAFFGFDYETEKLLFYGVVPKNLHSITRLPDGKFVGACSLTSDRLVLIDLNGHPFEPAKQKYTQFASLHGAHGVEWDEERNCLFALGYTYIVRYDYDPATSKMTETGRWNYLLKDGDCHGHDFTPDGHGGYYFTVSQSVRHFDPETGEVRWYAPAHHAKSFHQADVKGDLYCIANNRFLSDRAIIIKGKNRREIMMPEGSLVYKFRWLNP